MLLALDTATTTASVAVYDLTQAALLGECTWQARRRHTQDLLTTAQALMAQVEVAPAALTALAVTTGPGSFTGVRIALSAVKGIGLGLPTPPQVVGVPTLTVTAAPWIAPARATRAVLWAVIQAGRGRYHWTVFAGELTLPDAAAHATGSAAELAAALAQAAPQPVWLAGEIAADLAAAVAPLGHVVQVDGVLGLRRAGALAQIAAQRLAAGHADDLAALQPLYLQEPG